MERPRDRMARLRDLPLRDRMLIFGTGVAAFGIAHSVAFPFIRAGSGKLGVRLIRAPFSAISKTLEQASQQPAVRRLKHNNSSSSKIKNYAQTKRPVFIDLGSGTGRVAIAAARAGFDARGVECNPWLVRWSKFSARRDYVNASKDRTNDEVVDSKIVSDVQPASSLFESDGVRSEAQFMKGDLFDADISEADVVFVFLPNEAALEKLHGKLDSELKPGALVVSYGARIPMWRPSLPPQNQLFLYTKSRGSVADGGPTDDYLKDLPNVVVAKAKTTAHHSIGQQA